LFDTSIFSDLVVHKLFLILFIGVDEGSFNISLPLQTMGEHSLSIVILIPLTSVFSLDTLVEDIPQPDESLRHSCLLGYLLFIIGAISNELKDISLDDIEYERGD